MNSLKIVTSDGGSLLDGIFGDNPDGIISTSNKPDIGDAVESAEVKTMKLRGASKGGPLLSKQSKALGKGPVFGKDCKKKDKTEKSKAGGKGDKSKGKGKGSPSPTESQSPTISPSLSPSETPTDTFEPTASWCLEVPPIDPATDSVLAVGGAAGEPSPDKTPRPTITPQPTDSSAPSSNPTMTARPTVTANPTPTEKAVAGGENVENGSFCQILNAIYTEDGIDLVNPDGPFSGLEKGGTAAVTDVVDVPVQPASTDGYQVSVTMQVLENVESEEVASALDSIVSPPSALHAVGCAAKARLVAFDIFSANKGDRRLQKASTLVVLRNWVCEDKTDCADSQCSVKCSTDINYVGTLESDDFKARLLAGFEEYFTMMDDLFDWYPQQEILKSDVEIDVSDTAGVNGVISGNQNQARGMRAGPFIGAATGMLAVLLLLVLFVRRRNRYDEEQVSHLKLDESADDTLYEGDSVDNHEYNTRDIHIVGEGDSVISHWTGYTGRGSRNKDDNYEVAYRDGIIRGRSTDVHQCSSATCEICAESRQAGVSFIKTGNSSIPTRNHSLPSDASRDYIAEDTVML